MPLDHPSIYDIGAGVQPEPADTLMRYLRGRPALERTICEDPILRYGVNAVIAALAADHRHPRSRTFLLLDGPGLGMEFQLLMAAVALKKSLRKPSMIVTTPAGKDRLCADAGNLGLDPLPRWLSIITYDALPDAVGAVRAKKEGLGLAVFEDAHLILSEGHLAHVLSLPCGCSIFAADAVNLDLRTAAFLLERAGACEAGQPVRLSNLAQIFRRCFQRGNLLRREMPFWGRIEHVPVVLDQAALARERRILKQSGAGSRRTLSKESTVKHLAQFTEELDIAAELAKVSHAVRRLSLLVAEGKKVILFASDALPSSFPDDLRSPLDAVADALDAKGISFARLTAPLSPADSEENELQLGRFRGSVFEVTYPDGRAVTVQASVPVSSPVLLVPRTMVEMVTGRIHHIAEGDRPRAVLDLHSESGPELLAKAASVSRPGTLTPSQYLVFHCENSLADTYLTPHRLVESLCVLRAMGSETANQFFRRLA